MAECEATCKALWVLEGIKNPIYMQTIYNYLNVPEGFFFVYSLYEMLGTDRVVQMQLILVDETDNEILSSIYSSIDF